MANLHIWNRADFGAGAAAEPRGRLPPPPPPPTQGQEVGPRGPIRRRGRGQM